MKKLQWSRLLCALVISGIVVFTAAMAKVDSPLVPPTAKFRGKSFEEWNLLASQWGIATELGEQTGLSDTVKKSPFPFRCVLAWRSRVHPITRDPPATLIAEIPACGKKF